MVSYDPLFKTMIDKNITSYNLIHKKGFSKATYYRIKKGMSVNTDTLVQLCELLDCEIQDIVRVVRKK